jgi:hypothetical protein
VYGAAEGLSLGELQTFDLTASAGAAAGAAPGQAAFLATVPLRAITVAVVDNHGHARFTCVHRIKVLGTLSPVHAASP